MSNLNDLAALDLNLLVAFVAIEEHRHVSRAARALGLSQPALSHALSRLRDTFDDELFVKTPRGVVPTPRAAELAVPIRRICADISDSILQAPAFVPARIERTFRIFTTDLVECLLAGRLTRRLQTEAPGTRVAFEALRFELPKKELESGHADLAIAGFFDPPETGYIQQRLYDDTFRGCARKGHALTRGRVTLKAYADADHILIAPGGELKGLVDKLLAKQKRTRKIVLGTSGFLASGFAVAESDAILTAPARLIERMEKILPLKSFPLPIDPPSITITQVFHQRNQAAPDHRWFRQLIHTLLADRA